MRLFPALELRWAGPDAGEEIDRALAALEDHAPTAIEEIPGGMRVFFASAADRDRARTCAADIAPAARSASADVPDEDWAERSQAALRSIEVGRVVVSPPWDRRADEGRVHLTIHPSMGFGTGHHASTRLCLHLLQQLPVRGQRVLDVGTGSGVLAIAAVKLGAASAVGIDSDPDALLSARDNRALNEVADRVELRRFDVEAGVEVPGAPFDVVLANLTGALLIRQARVLSSIVRPLGWLIASGIETHEASGVEAALVSAGTTCTGRADEAGWAGLILERAASTSPTASTAS